SARKRVQSFNRQKYVRNRWSSPFSDVNLAVPPPTVAFASLRLTRLGGAHAQQDSSRTRTAVRPRATHAARRRPTWRTVGRCAPARNESRSVAEGSGDRR